MSRRGRDNIEDKFRNRDIKNALGLLPGHLVELEASDHSWGERILGNKSKFNTNVVKKNLSTPLEYLTAIRDNFKRFNAGDTHGGGVKIGASETDTKFLTLLVRVYLYTQCCVLGAVEGVSENDKNKYKTQFNAVNLSMIDSDVLEAEIGDILNSELEKLKKTTGCNRISKIKNLEVDSLKKKLLESIEGNTKAFKVSVDESSGASASAAPKAKPMGEDRAAALARAREQRQRAEARRQAALRQAEAQEIAAAKQAERELASKIAAQHEAGTKFMAAQSKVSMLSFEVNGLKQSVVYKEEAKQSASIAKIQSVGQYNAAFVRIERDRKLKSQARNKGLVAVERKNKITYDNVRVVSEQTMFGRSKLKRELHNLCKHKAGNVSDEDLNAIVKKMINRANEHRASGKKIDKTDNDLMGLLVSIYVYALVHNARESVDKIDFDFPALLQLVVNDEVLCDQFVQGCLKKFDEIPDELDRAKAKVALYVLCNKSEGDDYVAAAGCVARLESARDEENNNQTRELERLKSDESSKNKLLQLAQRDATNVRAKLAKTQKKLTEAKGELSEARSSLQEAVEAFAQEHRDPAYVFMLRNEQASNPFDAACGGIASAAAGVTRATYGAALGRYGAFAGTANAAGVASAACQGAVISLDRALDALSGLGSGGGYAGPGRSRRS